MSAAAEWARISVFPRGPAQDERTIGMFSVTNLTWAQQRETIAATPLFGRRREWFDYSFETTGYGSLELCGPLAYRLTIVHAGDDDALHDHHRLVRAGRLTPPWFRRRPRPGRIHVVDRDGLVRAGADARGSWLFATQRIARLCGVDDDVARLAGPALRQLLWAGREHLGSAPVAEALDDLRQATEALGAELTSYRTALDDRVCGERDDVVAQAQARAVRQLARHDLESIRLEARVLAEVRQQWRSRASGA